jgi:hypothetical protein
VLDKVHLYRAGEGLRPAKTVGIDRHGDYRFANVPAGNYTLLPQGPFRTEPSELKVSCKGGKTVKVNINVLGLQWSD